MNLENLKELITKDSQIDSTELGIESLKIPQIHSKYLTILSDVKLLLTKQQSDLAILKLRKWKIYTLSDIQIYQPPSSSRCSLLG